MEAARSWTQSGSNQRNDNDDEAEDVDVEELDETSGILDALNFKVVARDPGDPGYSRLTYLPDEAKIYRLEVCRLQDELVAKDIKHRDELKQANEKAQFTAKIVHDQAEKAIAAEKIKVAELEEAKLQLELQFKDAEERNIKDKTELEVQNQKLSTKQRELEESAQAQMQKFEELKAEIQNQKEDFARKEDEHEKEKQQLQKLISEREQGINEYKKASLERQTELENEKKKMVELQAKFDKVEREKTNLDLELEKSKEKVSEQCLQLKEQEEAISTLRNQNENQAEKWEQCKAELEKAKKIIDEKEVELKEAEGIIRDQQKVIDDGKDDKKKLEKLLQTNKSLDERVANLNGGIAERQREIDRLENELARQRQQNNSAQVKYRSLRDSVFSLNSEFSSVIQHVCAASQHNENRENEEGDALSTLESLKTHLSNKIKWWEENQKSTKAELAKTNRALQTLTKTLEDARKKSIAKTTATQQMSAAPPQLPPTSSSSSSSSSLPQTVAAAAPVFSYRNAAKGSATENSEAEANTSSSLQALCPVNPLVSVENDDDSMYPPLNLALPPSSSRCHGIDSTKTHLGWYCICDNNNDYKSLAGLNVHLYYFKSKFKFKCFICPRRFYAKCHLSKHLKKSHSVASSKHNCLVCGMTFSSWKKLFQHSTTVHTVQRCRKYLQSRRKPVTVNSSPLKTKTPSSPKPIRMRFSRRHSAEWNIVSSTGISPPEEDSLLVHDNVEHVNEDSVVFGQDYFPPTPPDTSNDSVQEQESIISTQVDYSTSQYAPSHSTKENCPEIPISPDALTQSNSEELENVSTEGVTAAATASPPQSNNGNKSDSSTLATNSNPEHAVDQSKSHLGFLCVCEKKFSSKRRLNLHIQYKTLEWKFKCQNCEHTSFNLSQLRKHYDNVHKMTNFLKEFIAGCIYCGTMYSSREEYDEHSRLIHGLEPRKKGPVIASACNSVGVALPPSNTTVPPATPSTSATLLQIKMEPQETDCTSGQEGSSSSPAIKKHGFDWSKEARHKNKCLCGHIAKSHYNLKEHIHAKTGEKQFLCTICEKGFTGTNLLRKHMRSVHKMQYLLKGCRKCGSCFNSLSELWQHRNAEHPPRIKLIVDLSQDEDGSTAPVPTVGDQCHADQGDKQIMFPGPSTSSENRNVQLLKHSKDNSKDGFVCCCGSILSSEEELEQHFRKSNYDLKKFECNICQERFWKLICLHKHLVGIHDVSPANLRTKDYEGCPDCGKLFRNKQLLDQHCRQVHPKSLTSGSLKRKQREMDSNDALTPVIQPKKQNICQSDNESAIDKSLFTHALGLVPTVSKKNHAIDSTKRHLGYFCVCKTKFRTLENLQRHMRHFNGEGKYKCDLCFHRFLYLSQLKKHFRSKHKILNSAKLKNLGIRLGDSKQSDQHAHGSSSFGEHAIVNAHSPVPPPQLSPAVFASEVNTSPLSPPSNSLSVPPPELSPQVFSNVATSSSSSSFPQLFFKEHGINVLNRNGHFCVCGSQFPDQSSLRSHILDYVINKESPQKKSTHEEENEDPTPSIGPSIIIPTRVQASISPEIPSPAGSVPAHSQQIQSPKSLSSRSPLLPLSLLSPAPHRQNISEEDWGSGKLTAAVTASSSHHQQQYSFASTENNEADVIVDAHLTFEKPLLTHGIDSDNASVGHFCWCGLEFSNQQELNNHVSYNSQRKFRCCSCNSLFLNVGLLRKHMLSVHKIIYNVSSGCRDCGKTFSTNMEFHHHIRSVHNRGVMWEQGTGDNVLLLPPDVKYVPPTPPPLDNPLE